MTGPHPPDHTRWPPVLSLPGWQGSGSTHWQGLWEAQHGFVRVEQADWMWPRRGDWMARLDEAVLATVGSPIVLVAHSLGCHLVAAWSAHSSHTARIGAALLVAPPDLDAPELPPQLAGWRPAVRRRLPFPATVVISDDDTFARIQPSLALAGDWGAQTIRAGARGHLNADSGLDAWPEGFALLRRCASVGD